MKTLGESEHTRRGIKKIGIRIAIGIGVDTGFDSDCDPGPDADPDSCWTWRLFPEQ